MDEEIKMFLYEHINNDCLQRIFGMKVSLWIFQDNLIKLTSTYKIIS